MQGLKARFIAYMLLIGMINSLIPTEILLEDVNDFLNPNTDFQELVKQNKKKSRKNFICHKKKGLVKGSYHWNTDFDTKSGGCGWEIGQITARCHNNGIENLQFGLRNVINTLEHKKTNAIGSTSVKSIIIPRKVYINRINKSYFKCRRNRHSYLTRLSFELSNGQTKSIVCGNGNRTESSIVSKLERVTGFFGNRKAGRITRLDFYKHSVAKLKGNGKSKRITHRRKYNDYYSLIIDIHDKKDRNDEFIGVGPFGCSSGEKFDDPYLFGHWKIKRLTIAYDSERITAIKTTTCNKFFHHSQTTKTHGESCMDGREIKDIAISDDIEIKRVAFILNDAKEFCGMVIGFSNGTSTGPLGCVEGVKGNWKKDEIVLKDNQEIMGFTGYETSFNVISLGLMVIEKNKHAIITNMA